MLTFLKRTRLFLPKIAPVSGRVMTEVKLVVQPQMADMTTVRA